MTYRVTSLTFIQNPLLHKEHPTCGGHFAVEHPGGQSKIDKQKYE